MIDHTTAPNDRAPLLSERARTLLALFALFALISLAASTTALL